MVNAYKQAGVDVEAGYESVRRMKKHIQKTNRPEVLGGLGGFGGMFDLSSINMKEPVLVSGTDGVGTKLKLAFQMKKHDTIGIDVVGMCVNDIVAQGAAPLYFLDYLALGNAAPQKIEEIVKGVADGCVQAGCALIGGETAEMPGMYDVDEYDIAGFAVGAVEKSNIITGDAIEKGDLLIGLSSNGVHSNGFSLIRKILEENRINLEDQSSDLGKTVGEALLTPTRIYVKSVLNLVKRFKIEGIAHITGGGFHENIPRMLPAGLGAHINLSAWKRPAIFDFIMKNGQLSQKEMFHVFNMGIGMVLCVKPSIADDVIAQLSSEGEKAYVIGKISDESGVHFE
ncbi:phosphoribosylformylglycinamidine cyclo-ligase [Salinibacillus xinjiangensis]|uniref:Phosphoribosylformylglycinamidine cyclo-ligase n=1 Tax=Salinibacillus xinjiangensis TaxID=1229268 RepID=A0A6G1XAX8_9BACI|nr:phosphoribosylformylglycinamidine cyclo-ligase [Salinibacillus xinjiangensis]MRG88056.1 phosphoribosylformylglycinamidine cyclo-ligase [Salinibacillus xinjiangensis]